MNFLFASYLPLSEDPVQVTWMEALRKKGVVDFVHFPSNVHRKASVILTIRFIIALIWRKKGSWYACDPYSGFWVALVAKLRGVEMHYISFELYSEFNPWNRRSKLIRKELEWREALIFRTCKSAYFSNAERARYYSKKFRIGNEKVFVFENIPTYPEFEDTTLNQELKSWLTSNKVCVYQGSIGSRPIHLFGTAAVFLKQHGYKFLIVSKKTEQLERLASVHSNMRHEEYMSPGELNKVLALCDLGFACYHSRDKNNEFCAPVKVFDYLRHGIPFIITRHASLGYLKKEFSDMIFEFDLESMEELENSVSGLIRMAGTKVASLRLQDRFLSPVERIESSDN